MMVNRRAGWLLSLAGAAGLAAVGFHRTAQAQDSVPSAKVTPWAAMEIANQQVHGKPLSANYELDEGHWLYDVMIAKGKTLHVVEVDANTGKANKEETSTPAEEAKELDSDLSKALGLPAGKATIQEKDVKEKGEKPN
jgi:hypothetical protein